MINAALANMLTPAMPAAVPVAAPPATTGLTLAFTALFTTLPAATAEPPPVAAPAPAPAALLVVTAALPTPPLDTTEAHAIVMPPRQDDAEPGTPLPPGDAAPAVAPVIVALPGTAAPIGRDQLPQPDGQPRRTLARVAVASTALTPLRFAAGTSSDPDEASESDGASPDDRTATEIMAPAPVAQPIPIAVAIPPMVIPPPAVRDEPRASIADVATPVAPTTTIPVPTDRVASDAQPIVQPIVQSGSIPQHASTVAPATTATPAMSRPAATVAAFTPTANATASPILVQPPTLATTVPTPAAPQWIASAEVVDPAPPAVTPSLAPALSIDVHARPRIDMATTPPLRADPAAPTLPLTAGPAMQVFASAIVAASRRDSGHDAIPASDTAATTIASIAAPIAQAAATDDAQQGALDMSDTRWPHAMIDRIEQLRNAANATDTRIRLLPDALGGIDVSVKRDGDMIHVHFTAEQAATRALIQDAQPRLATIAQERGLSLGQTSVGVGVDAGQGQAWHQQRQPQPAPVLPVAPPAAGPGTDVTENPDAATSGRLA